MSEEIRSIEKNNTWGLVDPLKECNLIRVKWGTLKSTNQG